MTDASMKRWVSIFEIYGPPGGERARLGTGTYEEVFSREVRMPRIGCLFSHASDEYLRHFVRFGTAHFDESTKKMVCSYGSSIEKTGGPLWLMRRSQDVITTGLACIPHEHPVPHEGYWMRVVLDQPPRLITSSQALAELAGVESPATAPAIHVIFQGSLTAIIELAQGSWRA